MKFIVSLMLFLSFQFLHASSWGFLSDGDTIDVIWPARGPLFKAEKTQDELF